MEYPDQEWLIADEKVGWNIEGLAEAMDGIAAFGSIAAMVVHRGRIVAASGHLTEKVLVRSIRKSLLSSLIGIAVQHKQIDLGSTLAELNIDDVEPGLTEQEKRATVRDLLTARSGVYHAALAEPLSMTASKPARGSALPGSRWVYNNWDFNVLGTIYERATGQPIYDAFLRRIAQPIGMQDFTPEDGFYLRGEQSEHPAYHVKMTVRDLARFGHLYLNDGRWRHAEVVPADWVIESKKSHSRVEHGGYGYMWWTYGRDRGEPIISEAGPSSRFREFRFSAEGSFGQMISVVPDKGLVLANLAVSRERSQTEWDGYRAFIRSAIRACPSATA